MIRGKLTLLTGIEIADAVNYHRWINDEATNHYRGLHHPQAYEHALAFIEAIQNPTDREVSFMVRTLDGKSIGLIGIRKMCVRSRRGEIWIYLGERSEWRKGYGSDAMNALIAYGFHSLNLNRIWLEMDPGYPGLIKMYNDLGFVREGTLRKDHYRHGEYRDAAIFGLLRDEWEQRD